MAVIVAGGGITGLAAARDLGRAGVPTLLLEPSPRLGGKIGTDHVDGFVVERGPDSFLATRPQALALARELGLGDALIGVREPRTVYIRRGGRMIPMPEGLGLVLPTRVWPFVRTPLFSWPEKARMGIDLVAPRLAPADDVSVGSFLERRLGRSLVDRLAGPLVGGIYGTDIDELSLDAVVPQLREAEARHRSLLLAGLADGRAARRARAAREAAARAASPSGDASAARPLGVFVSLTGGVGDLVDALESSLRADAAVTVRTGIGLVAIELSGAGVAARLSDGSVIHAEAVILAVPGPVAATLVEPFAAAAAAAIAGIPHGSSSVVSLGYRTDRLERPLVGHGVLVPPSERLPISACTWSSEKWVGRAPDGAVLVRAFLPGSGPGRTDAELTELARSAAEPLIGAHGAPDLVRVSRAVDSMPRYTVGHLERVARAEAALAAVPAVVLAGAPYRGVGLPDCIAQGRAAAARLGERLMTPAVEAARQETLALGA